MTSKSCTCCWTIPRDHIQNTVRKPSLSGETTRYHYFSEKIHISNNNNITINIKKSTSCTPLAPFHLLLKIKIKIRACRPSFCLCHEAHYTSPLTMNILQKIKIKIRCNTSFCLSHRATYTSQLTMKMVNANSNHASTLNMTSKLINTYASLITICLKKFNWHM